MFDPNNIDQNALKLTQAIGLQEGGGKFAYNDHSGDAGTSKGAYQWQPGNYEAAAKKYGIDPTDFSPQAQNKVAYMQVKDRLDAGLKPWEVASEWNSGNKDNWKDHSGNTIINGQKIHYDTPAYVQNVKNYYSKLNGSVPPSDTSQDNSSGNVDLGQGGTDGTQAPDANATPGGMVGKVADFIGGSKLAQGLGQTIANAGGAQQGVIDANQQAMDIQTNLLSHIKELKAQGKDTSRLDKALQQITQQIQETGGKIENLGTGGLSNRDVIGSSIQLAANVIPGAAKGTSLLTKTLAGAATGYAYDVGNKLQDDNKSLDQAFTPGLGTVVGASLPFAGHLISSLTRKIAGFTAGTGEQVIQRALDNPDAVGDAVHRFAQTPEAKQELVDTATTAIQDFVKQKGQEFGNTIDNMAVKEGGSISKQPVIDALQSSFEDFGIQEKGGKLDFTNSALSKESESTLKQVYNKINSWTDESPQGLDKLRQYIKGEMGNYKVQGSSKVDAILNDAMKAIRSHLTDQIPEYGGALSTFSEKTQTTKDLLKELQLAGTAKTSTKLSNIMKIFKKDPTVLDNLYKVMGHKEAEDFLNQVSGAILSDWIPAGATKAITRTVGEAGVAAGVHALGASIPATGGAVLAGAALASPRIVGKVARVASQGVGKLAGNIIKKGATQASAQITK